MPIVIASCPNCARLIELDTLFTVMLTGNDEKVWNHVRQRHRPGERINVSDIAQLADVTPRTVYNILTRLVFLKLVRRQKIKRNHRYYVAPSVSIPHKRNIAA